MDFFLLCGACLLCLSAVLILRPIKEDFARLLSAVAGCLFLPVGLGYLQEFFTHFFSLGESSALAGYSKLLVKATGIAFLASAVSNLCKDCNEASLGEKLQFCARCSILALSLPVVKELLGQVESFL